MFIRLLATWPVAILLSLLLFNCGGEVQVHPVDPPAVLEPSNPRPLGPCFRSSSMLTLGSAFTTENEKLHNTPAFIVKLEKSNVNAKVTAQSEWQACVQQLNMDFTTTAGDALLNKTAQTNVESTSQNSTFLISLGTDSDGFAWQSWHHDKGYTVYIDQVSVHLYAHMLTFFRGYVTWHVQLFESDKTTPLSTVVDFTTYMNPNTTYNALTLFDFSSQYIDVPTATEIWIKVTMDDMYTADIASEGGVKYHSTTSTYADGQFDGKAYNEVSESTNRGDLAFRVTFMPAYVESGLTAHQIDLGSAPSVDGEWRMDQYTPDDSAVTISANGYDSIDTVSAATLSSGSGTDWYGLADNGTRMVRVSDVTPYIQYSDNRGATWSNAASGAFASRAVSFNGSRFVAVSYGSNTSKYSTDGSNWSSGGNLPASGSWSRIVWTGVTFFTAMYGGDGATSTDGASWTARTMAASVKNWLALGWNGTVLLAVEKGTTYAAISDSAGASWTQKTLASAENWIGATHGAGLWVIVSNDTSATNTSADATIWSTGARASSSNVQDVAFNGNLFVAVGTNFDYSTDGLSWTHDSTTVALLRIVQVDGNFVANAVTSGVAWSLRHPGFTSLGVVEDGDPITTRKRYYSFTAKLDANTTQTRTPAIKSVQAWFPTWLTFSTHSAWGYEPSLVNVSSLQTAIDTFDASTVGQISLQLAHSQNVSSWMASNNPRNREARILMGFLADGFDEVDFEKYYRGYVEEWKIGTKDTVTLTLRDFSKQWKGVPVPGTWETDVDDLEWTDQHPVDVMLDILVGYVGVQPGTLDLTTFNEAKLDLGGWSVTRTLTGKTFDAKELLEQLRLLMLGYFIPQSNGKIKFKLWDAAEATVASLDETELHDVAYTGNSASLINKLHIYFNLLSNGDGRGSPATKSLLIQDDATSIADWQETKVKEIKDYWTPDSGSYQVGALSDKIITRYKNIPDVIDFSLDRRWIAIETGDIIEITTTRAPSDDLLGISAVHYQVVSRNLDLSKDRIPIKALRVA